jgi:ubiquinone biosynthesis monooxygenase Coq7
MKRLDFIIDKLITTTERSLRTLFGNVHALRPYPAKGNIMDQGLTTKERLQSIRLMRVNHTGEICAQALYTAQALVTQNKPLQQHLDTAAQEELDHLAWTRRRLQELEGSPSLLNPLWYTGAFAIGLFAGFLGDGVSLGFIVETEKQVETHLEGHIYKLPHTDKTSYLVIKQMQLDEGRHALDAEKAGAVKLPKSVTIIMQASAKMMTSTSYYI